METGERGRSSLRLAGVVAWLNTTLTGPEPLDTWAKTARLMLRNQRSQLLMGLCREGDLLLELRLANDEEIDENDEQRIDWAMQLEAYKALRERAIAVIENEHARTIEELRIELQRDLDGSLDRARRLARVGESGHVI
jgi:hypothetical protein